MEMICGKDQGCLMRMSQHRGESMLRALMMMIERQRATRVCGRVEGCSSARSLVGVTIMYLRSSVHFICRWPFSPAFCTSCRCLTLPSRFWRPAPQPLDTCAAASLACHFYLYIQAHMRLEPEQHITLIATVFFCYNWTSPTVLGPPSGTRGP